MKVSKNREKKEKEEQLELLDEEDIELESVGPISKKAKLQDLDKWVSKKSIVDLFPMPQFLEHQESVIEQAEGYLEDGKTQVLFIQGPPGSGKTAISMAISRKFGARICTPQNLLLAQYKKDFPEVKLVMGKDQYECCRTDKHVYRSGRKVCAYTAALNDAVAARVSVFNYHSFVAHRQRFPISNVVVLDEGHTIRQFAMEVGSVTLSRKVFPTLRLERDETMEELVARLIPFKNGGCRRNNYADELRTQRHRASAERKSASGYRLTILDAELDEIDRAIEKLRRIEWLWGADRLLGRWVFEYNPWRDGEVKELHVKPIFVDDLVPGLLFNRGRRVVVLSATILNPETFARSVGVPMSKAAFIEIPSTFPKKNRPLLIYPVANMNRKTQEEDFPRLVTGIERILDWHPEQKGIVHSHSRDITKGIKDALAKKYPRLLFQKHGESRGDFLNRHYNGRKDSVIVAPAMYTGLDLRDDLARFQVMTKVPWPNLGDPQIMALKNKDEDCYLWLTAIAIAQAYGRPVRSKKDHAVSYMLDEGWYAFYEQALRRGMLPDWLVEAIIDRRGDVLSFLDDVEPEELEDGELDDDDIAQLLGGKR